MIFNKRFYWALGLSAAAMLVLTGATTATGITPNKISGAEDASVAPGEIDDGAELLDQASISLEEAIRAAQGAVSGDLGEIDLEMYQGVLVFNVDIGDTDAKIDASNGAVLGRVLEADDD